MAKKIKQLRYYGDKGSKAENNYPKGIATANKLASGSAFAQYGAILQLGIQTLPGTKFYLNGSNNPIIIGNTGIYELDVTGLTEINSIQFDTSSLALIHANDGAYLIVDILYEDGEE